MEMTKNRGDNGSPCRRPHPWAIGLPAIPFSRNRRRRCIAVRGPNHERCSGIPSAEGDQGGTPTSPCQKPFGCRASKVGWGSCTYGAGTHEVAHIHEVIMDASHLDEGTLGVGD